MERFTDRSKEMPTPVSDYAIYYVACANKLADYEDTGLEPEEINELLHSSAGPLHKRLGEWIMAEQEGRLVVLSPDVPDDRRRSLIAYINAVTREYTTSAALAERERGSDHA